MHATNSPSQIDWTNFLRIRPYSDIKSSYIKYHLVGGLFFQATSKNVNGMAINPDAIRIGIIIAGSNDFPIARKYGNG